jgi:hypothetical protein
MSNAREHIAGDREGSLAPNELARLRQQDDSTIKWRRLR